MRPALQSNTFLTYRAGRPAPPTHHVRRAAKPKSPLGYSVAAVRRGRAGRSRATAVEPAIPDNGIGRIHLFELRPRRKMASVAETVSVTTPSAVPLSVLSTGVGLRGRASCGRYKVSSAAVPSNVNNRPCCAQAGRLFGPELRAAPVKAVRWTLGPAMGRYALCQCRGSCDSRTRQGT